MPITYYTLTNVFEPGKEYIVANGNTGTIYMLSNVSGGSRILNSVSTTVNNNAIAIDDSIKSSVAFNCILYDANNSITTTLESNGSYLYSDNASGLRFEPAASLNRFWHYIGGKFWQFKSTADNGYTDTSTEYKYYLELNASTGFTDNHVDATSIQDSSIPPMYLFVEDDGTGVTATGVSLNKNTHSMSIGATTRLTVTVLPANTTNQAVFWSSSNSSVASVNATGLVTGISEGTATITVTTVSGNQTAQCVVTITNSGGGGSGSTPSSSAEIRTLKNSDGTLIIYPQTLAEGVYSSLLGTHLEDLLENKIMYLDENQTVSGVITFDEDIIGNLNGNADTATNADYATEAGSATNDSNGDDISATYVTLATDQTITSQKTFTSNTIASNYPIINLTQTGTISSYTGGHGIDFMTPNLASGGALCPIYFGKSSTPGNAGAIHFRWIGDNDPKNYISFSLYDSNDLLRVYNTGAVGINTAINSHINSCKLYVTGNTFIEDGCLSLKPTSSQSSYNQGIRIHSRTNDWGLIEFCADDNTGDTGTSTNSWLIGIMGATGNLYINQNGANAAKSARAWASSTGWTFGNTTLHDMAFNVENFQCGGTSWFHNKVTVSRNTSITNNYPAELAFRVIQSDNNVSTTGAYIRAYDDGDAQTYGLNLVIAGTSNVIIGSGESANACYTTDLKTSAAENLYLTSDGNIYFYTNCQTYANHTSAVYINTSGQLYGAVWNDYAEYREGDSIEPGYVMVETGYDTIKKSNERMEAFAGVSSDTFGFAIGETDKAKTPLAVSGRVLVYPLRPRDEYKPGDCVCAAAGGKVDIMTREEIQKYPDRIVGTVSSVPQYETWGQDNVPVNGRIWIKVK